jgi:hypothetical protein
VIPYCRVISTSSHTGTGPEVTRESELISENNNTGPDMEGRMYKRSGKGKSMSPG